jgi:hypothetical protein
VTAAHIKSSFHTVVLFFTTALLILNQLVAISSHSSLTAISGVSQLFLQLAWDPNYKAFGQTQQKTPFPPFSPTAP